MSPADVIIADCSGAAHASLHARRTLLRISGPDAFARVAPVLPTPPPHSHTIARCELRLRTHDSASATRDDTGSNLTDLPLPCLALRYNAPRSYTGEDTLELLIPANPALVHRVLGEFCAIPGVREARPGEFSARAYLNNRLSLEQAEGVAALIAARTADQLAAAEHVLSGRAGDDYRHWTDTLARLLALVEAGIDFTDQEDVVPIAPQKLAEALRALITTITKQLGSSSGSERRDTSPRVVLAGAPNAGKSTLYNALLGRTRAVTSPIAGSTRDALAEPLSLNTDAPGASAVTLIDLPGLDAALIEHRSGNQPDHLAQSKASDELASADVVIHCDPAARFPPIPNLRPGTPVLRVQTKADLVPAHAHALPNTLSVCAIDGWHLPALRRAIADAAWGQGNSAAIAVPRHQRTLASARDQLAAALTHVEHTHSTHALPTPELIAAHLRDALNTLGELTGAVSPDDILGRVFASFCIGK